MTAAYLPALPILLALVAPMFATANDEHDWDDWMDCDQVTSKGVKHCEEREADWTPKSNTIRADGGPNGGVSIVGWDEKRVRVVATLHVRAETKAEAQKIAGMIKVRMEEALITASGPEVSDDDHWTVSFRVWAPRSSNLDLVASNGPLAVRHVSGKMRLTTHNGPVSLNGVSGDVVARTHNGPLNVRLEGARWEGAKLDAETKNGPVNLRIPEKYSATIETGTLNGPSTSELPVRLRGGRWYTLELGEGGTELRVVTHNGPANILTF
jgi:DUF4097 and DUF4098 domain-containing protein YvlB